jgi:predicted  nucleic acid-binding Zn-ribbon protein
MGSGYKQPKDIKKALNKGREERRERRRQEQRELAEMTKADKLTLEISELKSRIKLVESDLNGQFKNNKLIENKLKMLQEDITKKEKELEDETRTENSN